MDAALIKAGARNGDVVQILGYELEFSGVDDADDVVDEDLMETLVWDAEQQADDQDGFDAQAFAACFEVGVSDDWDEDPTGEEPACEAGSGELERPIAEDGRDA